MTAGGRHRLALVLLAVYPAMLATNMLAARAWADLWPPFVLAFWRWAITFLLMLPLVGGALWRQRRLLWAERLDLFLLGLLGMFVCGAFVYIGADTTTATNIGVIYASAPIFILLVATFAFGESLRARQVVGVLLSLAGVLVVVAKGRLDVLLTLQFTSGDLWILAAAVSWGLYSVLVRYRPSRLDPMTRFAASCASGLLCLLPFHLLELAHGEVPPLSPEGIAVAVLIAVVASFAAYQTYGFLLSELGANVAGLTLYLGPLYTAGLAAVLLGEELHGYHAAGLALVFPGVLLATARRRPGRG